MTKDNDLDITRLEVQNANSISLAKVLRSNKKTDEKVRRATSKIIRGVKERGETALQQYAREFDGLAKNSKLKVSAAEIRDAYGLVSKSQVRAIKELKDRVEAVEKGLLAKLSGHKVSFKDYSLTLKLKAVEAVGCYVPGGQGSYPTSLIMTATPAKAAGVQRIVVCSPPSRSGLPAPLTLVASDVCGVDEVYKVGGAHAIAAMAFGTVSIPRVNKIVGPGNAYVTTAKVLLSDTIPIDLPAGPSEVLIMADETAKPRLIARDMFSQAEHGRSSICGLVTTSNTLASRVKNEMDRLLPSSPRSREIRDALSANGFIVVAKSLGEMVQFSNAFAPEHLELMTRRPREVAEGIVNGGLILLGDFSPASISDYCLGTNHVLPTGGSANAYSALSVLSFTRMSWVADSDKGALKRLAPQIKVLAEAEGLKNHYLAVEERLR